MVRLSELTFKSIIQSVCLVTLATGTIACTKKESTSEVKITIPHFSRSVSQSVSAQSGGGDWGLSDPTAIGDFDCFAVFVGANDPEMNRYQCSDQNDNPMFRFGRFAGLASSGSTLSIEVPSGPQRTVSLIGFDLASGATCENMGPTADITSSQYSAPFLLGSTTKDLTPGNVPLTINASFDANKKIGDCDFGNGSSGTSGIFLGSGSDGDETITSSTDVDLTTYALGNGRKFTAIKRVNGIAPAGGGIVGEHTVSLASSASTLQYAVNDEVMLYIAAGSPGATSCGEVYPGFRIEGKITSFSSPHTSMRVKFNDSRAGTIPTANLAAAAQDGSTFCRAVIVRVPHFNNLTLDLSAGARAKVPPFGSLSGTDHNGGILSFRVKGILKSVTSSSSLSASGVGFQMSPNGIPGESTNGFVSTASTSPNNTGGGGGVSPGHYPGGGGHGGIGADGGTANTGGNIIGDEYGCQVLDTSRRCLFGKMFFGGAGGSHNSSSGPDGAGGGLIAVFANQIDVPASNSLNFLATGKNSSTISDGGSAGGSILVRALNITVAGSMQLNASGSDAGDDSTNSAGAGGGGRVHLDLVRSCTTSSLSSVSLLVDGGISGPGFTPERPAANGTKMISGPGSGLATCPLPAP